MVTTVKERWPDCDIAYLVFEDSDRFVVFVDHEVDVDWETTDEFDQERRLNDAEHNAILNEAAIVESVPCDYLEKRIRLRFKRQIAEAIARSFSYDYSSARQMLSAAREFVRDRNVELSRFWYLSGSASATFIVAIAASGVWTFRDGIAAAIGESVPLSALVCFMGALGAMLSIILRMGRAALDCSSGRGLHYLESASRIVAGSLSALALFLAVKSGLLLPQAIQPNAQPWVLLLLAFVAGASERLAPSVISKVELSVPKDLTSARKAQIESDIGKDEPNE